MENRDYSQEEQLIAEAIINAREVQDFIWQELSFEYDSEFDLKKWGMVFQKRVDKIMEININHPNAKVELRKRLLQQAALSILAMKVLGNVVLY